MTTKTVQELVDTKDYSELTHEEILRVIDWYKDMAYEQGLNAGLMQNLKNGMRTRADEHRMRAVESVQKLMEGGVNE